MTRSISNDNGVTNITINKEMEPNHNNVKSSNRNEAVPDLIKVTSDLNPDSLVWVSWWLGLVAKVAGLFKKTVLTIWIIRVNANNIILQVHGLILWYRQETR
jgi:hypothetical protein